MDRPWDWGVLGGDEDTEDKQAMKYMNISLQTENIFLGNIVTNYI